MPLASRIQSVRLRHAATLHIGYYVMVNFNARLLFVFNFVFLMIGQCFAAPTNNHYDITFSHSYVIYEQASIIYLQINIDSQINLI